MLEALDIDDEGAKYLPFAQSMLRKLKAYLLASGGNFGRREYVTPDGHGLVKIRTRRSFEFGEKSGFKPGFTPDERIDDWYDYIKISSGRDWMGFFMSWRQSDHPHTYWAHYVDAVVEEINVKGVPRVSTTPADRTKGLVLPNSLLTREPSNYKLGSLYSGQMRRVVQCQLIKGIEPKFSYSHAKTHGILEWPFPRSIGATVEQEAENYRQRRFWVVEISSQGVFAAPLTFGLTCMNCASNLSDYLPTEQQIKDDPSLAVYKAELSLAWAFTNRNADNKIKRLMQSGEASTLYSYGSPWYPAMGWAFSYSGMQAANIVVNAVTDGFDFSAVDDYYETRLITLSFDVQMDNDDEAILTASFTVGEPGRVTFKRSSFGTMWVPGADINTWDGVYPFINQLDVSGPVHVFYDGEQQIVTRWERQASNVDADKAIEFSSIDPTWNNNLWDGSANGSHIYLEAVVDVPIVQEADCFGTYNSINIGGGHDNSAYTTENYGFSGPFDLKLDSYSRFTKQSSTSWAGSEYEVSNIVFNNTYSLCGGGTASCTINQVTYDRDAMKTREDLTQSQSGSSVVILLPQEREAVCGFKVTNYSATGTRSFLLSKHRVRITEAKVGGSGAFTDWSKDDTAWRGGNTTPPSEPVNTTTSSAEFHLAASGGIRYSQAIPNINLSQDLSPFLVYDVGLTETANSGLTFMRGGLFYEDPRLTPPNQAQNKRMKVDDVNVLDVGFASLDGRINIGFVGQV